MDIRVSISCFQWLFSGQSIDGRVTRDPCCSQSYDEKGCTKSRMNLIQDLMKSDKGEILLNLDKRTRISLESSPNPILTRDKTQRKERQRESHDDRDSFLLL